MPPNLPDYRFGSLIKGEYYAYARGLTINPSHLPQALDAMYKDGWELMGVFGETDSSKVGFIFKKRITLNNSFAGVTVTDEVLKKAFIQNYS